MWHQRADVLPAQYAAAVEACGGVPAAAAAGRAGRRGGRRGRPARRAGGHAAAPTSTPAGTAREPHPRTAGWRPDRDAWEIALLDAAEAAGLPVLGVCRGMQLMAVHAGGTLDQHTPDLVGHDEHSPGGDAYGEIEVATRPAAGSPTLVGDRLTVNCHHHQSVRDHPGFAAAAHAADGTLEAMEAPGDRFCVAVQWHPETAADVGPAGRAGAGRGAAVGAGTRAAREAGPRAAS